MKQKQIIFKYHYCGQEKLPSLLNIHPNPEQFSDETILATTAIMTQILANRHGLELALEMIQNAAYGHINKEQISLKWHNYAEEEEEEENP